MILRLSIIVIHAIRFNLKLVFLFNLWAGENWTFCRRQIGTPFDVNCNIYCFRDINDRFIMRQDLFVVHV